MPPNSQRAQISLSTPLLLPLPLPLLLLLRAPASRGLLLPLQGPPRPARSPARRGTPPRVVPLRRARRARGASSPAALPQHPADRRRTLDILESAFRDRKTW